MTASSRLRGASKGSVQIKASHERLQLVFRFNGRRHHLSLGVSDTKTYWALAEMKAKQIQLDILSGNFDKTLAKYKPQDSVSANELESLKSSIDVEASALFLDKLWEKLVEYKRPQCSANTKGVRYCLCVLAAVCL